MSSSQYIEMVTVLVSLMGVVLLITLLWFLLRKFVLGRSLLKPADKEVAPPSPVTQQVAAAVASAAQPLGAVTPTDEQPAAGATPVPSTQECPSPRGRGLAAAARRASVAVSRAVKHETAALLQSLAAGALSAQVPTDDDFENEDNKTTKPGTDTAPPIDEAKAGTKAPSPSSDQKGRTKPSPSTQFASDGDVAGKQGTQKADHEAATNEAPRPTDAEKERQAVSGGDVPGELQAPTADAASPSSGPVSPARGTEERVPKERAKGKDKKRKKSSAFSSPCGSPPLDKPDVKPETSTMRTKRKHKPSPDLSPKPPTENAGKEASSADAEQSSTVALPSTHAQRQPSTHSKGSRMSRKSSAAKPPGAWSEDISPPASWAPEVPGAEPNTSQRDTSTQECSPPALKNPDPPTPPVPNLDIFSREHSTGD